MENENSYRYVDGNIVYTSVKNPQGLFKYPIGRQGRLSVNGENVTNIDSNKPFINAVDIDWNGAVVDGNLINTTTDLLEWIDSKEGGGGSQGTSEKEYYELINYYLWSETTPATVSTRALLELNGWRTTCPNRPNNNSILWLYYVSVVKDENGTIIKEGRLSGPVPISGVNGSAGEDLVDREYIYLVFRTVLDFGIGNSNPYNWEISNQDDYLGPSGSLWQDHPSGVSNEWPYEYMSWRDKSGNSWGRFHTPILWSHYGVNGMDGDGVEYVFVRTSVDTAPVVSADLPLGEDPRADEFLPKVEMINGNGMISGSVASYSDGPNKKITRCTDNPIGVDSIYRYEWVLQRKTEIRQILDNGVVVGEEKVWKEYTGTMAKWGVYSGDSLVNIQNGQLFINGTATNIWVEGANGHGIEILNVPDFSPSDPSTWPRNTYVGQLIQCGGHIYVYLNGGWQDLGEAYGAGKYVHIAYADSLTFSGTQIIACTGFAVDAGPQPKNWFGIYSDGNELDAGTDFPSNVTISENENNPEVYNGETRLDIINKYKWNYTVGKDGNGVEYIYCVSAPGHIPDTPAQSLNVDEYLPIITENHNDVDSRFYNFGVTVTEGGQQVSKWTDDPIVTSESTGATYTLSPTFPILWWSQRKKINGVWQAFSKPVEHDTYTTSPEMYSIVSDYSVIKKDGETYTPGSITFTQMYYKENYTIRTEKYIMGYYIDGDIEHILFQDNSPSIRTESITLNLAQLRPLSYIKVGLYQLPDGNETPSTMVYQSLTIPVMSNGVSYYNKEIYKCIKLDLINNINQKPANVINPPGWSTNINIVPSEEDLLDTLNPVHLIMYTGVIIDGVLLHYYDEDNHTEIYWTGPYDLGTPNNPGEDGLKYEFIYKRSQTPINWGDTPNVDIGNLDNYWDYDYPVGVKPSLIYHGYVKNSNGAYEQSLGSRTTDDWIPKGWTDNPQGVGYVLEGNNTVFYKYEYCAVRTRYKSNNWNAFSDPFVWSVYGEKGTDGDGVEYVFARTKSEDIKPYTIDHPSGDSNYLNTDYLPVIYKISSSDPSLKENTIGDPNYNGKIRSDYANNRINDDYIHWSDDPQGVTLDWPVEWVIKRKKVDGEWLDFQSEPAIWAKYGFNSVRLALDNEHEDFLYSDSTPNGPIAPSDGATSLAHLYDGSTEITQNITWWVSCDGGSNYSLASNYDTDGSLVKARISSSGLLTVSHIKANSVKVKVKATYNGLDYYAEFTANKINLDKYDIIVKPNAIAFNDATFPSSTNINISAKRTKLNGTLETAKISNVNNSGNLRLYYGYVSDNGNIGNLSRVIDNTNPSELLSNINVTILKNNILSYAGIYFELRWYDELGNYRLCDYETVEIAKSSNGPAGATFKIIEAYKYGTNTIQSTDKPTATTIDNNTSSVENGWYLSMSSAASNAAAGATILYVCKAQFLKDDTIEGLWNIVGSWDGPTLYSGKNGKDSINVMISPENLILTLNTTSPYNIDLSNAFVTVSANKGGVPVTLDSNSISITNSNNCLASVDNNLSNRINIDSINTRTLGGTDYYDSGYVSFSVAYDGYTYNKQFNFYVNLLGTWKETVIGDTNRAVAQSLTYAVDPDSGNVENFSHIGEYIRSSKEKVDTISEKVESRNLFGFTKGVVFDVSGYEVIPYIQGYGFEVYKFNSGFGNRIAGAIDNLGINKEGTYVFSMEVKTLNPNLDTFRFQPCYYNIVPIEGLDLNGNYVPDSLWKKVAFKVELTQNTLGSSFTSWINRHGYLDIYSNKINRNDGSNISYNSESNIRLYIRKLQIEYGNVPTSFRICKEDENYAIEHEHSAISNNWNIGKNPSNYSGETFNTINNIFEGLSGYKNTSLFTLTESDDPFIEINSPGLHISKDTVYTLSFWAKAEGDIIVNNPRSGTLSITLGGNTKYSSSVGNYYRFTSGNLYLYLRFTAPDNNNLDYVYRGNTTTKIWYIISKDSTYYNNPEASKEDCVNILDNNSVTLKVGRGAQIATYLTGIVNNSGISNSKDHGSIHEYNGVIDSSYSEGNNPDYRTFVNLTPEWRKYYVHFYSQVNTNNAYGVGFRINNDCLKRTFVYYSVCDLKFEKGYITSDNRSDYSTVIKQTSRSIDMSVLVNSVKKAGLELTTNENGEVAEGVIKATADKFEILNSNGDTTFSVDDDGNIVGAGNASFGGNISAKSILCGADTYKCISYLNFVSNFKIPSTPQFELCYYCINDITGWLLDNESNISEYKSFEGGLYYFASELSGYNFNLLNTGSTTNFDFYLTLTSEEKAQYNFIECTGPAELILCSELHRGNNENNVSEIVTLPVPEDFKFKTIEIVVSYLSSGSYISVNCFKLPAFYLYQTYSAIEGSGDGRYLSPSTGTTGLLYDVNLTSNGIFKFTSLPKSDNYWGSQYIWALTYYLGTFRSGN